MPLLFGLAPLVFSLYMENGAANFLELFLYVFWAALFSWFARQMFATEIGPLCLGYIISFYLQSRLSQFNERLNCKDANLHLMQHIGSHERLGKLVSEANEYQKYIICLINFVYGPFVAICVYLVFGGLIDILVVQLVVSFATMILLTCSMLSIYTAGTIYRQSRLSYQRVNSLSVAPLTGHENWKMSAFMKAIGSDSKPTGYVRLYS